MQRRKGAQGGHKRALGRAQAREEVSRLVNHLLANAYKLIAIVGRDRNIRQVRQGSQVKQARPGEAKQARTNASKAGQDYTMQERCTGG